MSKKAPKISYDKESQVLSIVAKKAKSVDSDIHDNIVIDYDKKGNVVRINLYNFDFKKFRETKTELKEFVKTFGVSFSR